MSESVRESVSESVSHEAMRQCVSGTLGPWDEIGEPCTKKRKHEKASDLPKYGNWKKHQIRLSTGKICKTIGFPKKKKTKNPKHDVHQTIIKHQKNQKKKKQKKTMF